LEERWCGEQGIKNIPLHSSIALIYFSEGSSLDPGNSGSMACLRAVVIDPLTHKAECCMISIQYRWDEGQERIAPSLSYAYLSRYFVTALGL
jgi:hypothetical protein